MSKTWNIVFNRFSFFTIKWEVCLSKIGVSLNRKETKSIEDEISCLWYANLSTNLIEDVSYFSKLFFIDFDKVTGELKKNKIYN